MKKMFFAVLWLMLGFNLFAQEPVRPISKEEQEKVLDIVKQYWKNSMREPPPFTSGTKVMKETGCYVMYKDKFSASFEKDYLANLMMYKEPDYLVYNYSDSIGYEVIAYVIDAFYDPIITSYPEGKAKILNTLAKYYDLNKVPLLGLVGVGYCVFESNTIWIVKGDTRTDLNTYLKEKFSLADYRNNFLQSTIIGESVKFIQK